MTSSLLKMENDLNFFLETNNKMSIKQEWKNRQSKCTCLPGGATVSQANNVWNILKFPPMQLILISQKKILNLKKLRKLIFGCKTMLCYKSHSINIKSNPSTYPHPCILIIKFLIVFQYAYVCLSTFFYSEVVSGCGLLMETFQLHQK